MFVLGCTETKTEQVTDTQTIAPGAAATNRLEVYCFHGTRQCETCTNMKANTKSTLERYFSAQLKDSTIVFSIIDVDDETNLNLAEKFEATGTALMVNKVTNGKDSIIDWSDFAFEKANDNELFISELKTKLEAVLK
jgi:hypothetical protein